VIFQNPLPFLPPYIFSGWTKLSSITANELPILSNGDLHLENLGQFR
jgi:hypothetical protein